MTANNKVRKFSRDEKSLIAHALMHITHNRIDSGDGWYCGNREQFVKRHKKAVELMQSFLKPTES